MTILRKLIAIAAALTATSSEVRAQSWENITGNVPGTISTSNIGPMDSDGTRLYVLGATGVFVSSDGGQTFSEINTVDSASYTLDQFAFRFIGFAGGKVWLGADPGSAALESNGGLATLHQLSPGGTSWTKSDNGFPDLTLGNQADDIAFDTANGTYLALAANGGAFVSSNGTDWVQRNVGQGGIGLPSSVAAHNGVLFSARPIGAIRRSTDNGATWAPVATQFIDGLNGAGHLVNHNGRIIFPYSNGQITYVDGTPIVFKGIVFSDDDGLTWTHVQSTAIERTDAQSDGTTVFYGGTYYSGSGGITADPLDQTGVSGVPRRIIRVGDNLFMITSTGLFRRNVSTLDLRPTTQIAIQPKSSPPLIDGDSHTFRVLAGGVNLTYQWQKDGVAISGATGPELVFNPAYSTNSGSYTVVVTGDRDGPVTSTAATLSVQTPEPGKDDPTFPQMSQLRPNARTLVTRDFAVIELSGNYIARAESGGVVSTRNLSASSFWQMIEDQQGRLVIVGNGTLLRLDPQSLQDDPTFQAPTSSTGFTDVAELPGRGYLVSVASFAKISGSGAPAVLLLDYDGNIDPTFTTANFNLNATGTPPQVTQLEVSADGEIYALGNFNGWWADPATYNGSLNAIVRLGHNGAVDATFDPAFASDIDFFRVLRDGRLLVIDGFSTSQKPLVYQKDGTQDASFNSANATFSRLPADMAEQFNGRLIFVGNITSHGGQTVSGQVRLNADGTRDTTFFDAQSYGTSTSYYPVDISLDPRGFAYLASSSTSTSAKYQDSDKRGTIRIFAEKATFGIWEHPRGGTVDIGQSVVLRVTAFGAGLNYQWYQGQTALAGATNDTLLLSDFQTADNGDYSVEIAAGQVIERSRPASLVAVGAPLITVQPQTRDVLLGENHVVSVGVLAAAGTTFQWRKNGSAIAGATNRSFVLTNLQFSDGGRYSVAISNSLGSATSDVAVLTVNEITGGLVTAFTPLTLNDYVWTLAPMPDNTVIVGGEFSTVESASHGRFTRLGTNGRAIVGSWSDNPPGGADGIQMRDIEVLANGKVLIAGDHSNVQGNAQDHLTRLTADGDFDSSFVGSVFNQIIYAVKELPDGKILAGGSFTGPGQRLVLLNADGSHDSSFTLAANDYVNHIALQPDGKILVAGRFTTLGGQTANRIVRLNVDLTRDTTFNAPVINQEIQDFGVDGQGRIVIGGFFTQVDGQARNYLARLKPDGSLDTAFDVGTKFNNAVYAIDIQLNGKIVVGGQFTLRVERLLPDGADDPYFNFVNTPNGIVYDVATTPTGALYIGGQFSSPKSRVARFTTDKSDPAVTAPPQSVAVDLGGNTTLSVGVFTTTTATYQWFKDGSPISGATSSTYTITGATKADAGNYSVDVSNSNGTASSREARVAVLAEPVVIADLPENYTAVTQGGITLQVGIEGRAPLSFTWRKDGTPLNNGGRVSGADTATLDVSAAELGDAGRYSLTVSNDLGSVTSREVLVTVIEPPAGIRTGFDPASLSFSSGEIYAIEPTPDGGLVVGGYFTIVNGVNRRYLAKINSSGVLDTNFNPVINSGIQDVKVDPQGRIVIGGDFSSVNSTSAGRVARLLPDGMLDTSFNTTSGANNRVQTITILGNGQVFIGGRFGSYAGNSSAGQYGALLNSDGSLDTSFDVNPNHYVWDSVEVPGSPARLLLGGQGLIAGQAYLARVNLDGSLDSSFASTLNSYVYTLRLQPDGKVLVGGQFNQLNGASVSGVARLNPDGTTDSYTGQPSSAGQVYAFGTQLDGKVLVGGSYTTFNNAAHARLVRTQADGGADPTFATGTGFNSGTIRAIHVTQEGKIWVGGGFTSYDGTSSSGLLQLNGDPVLLAITRQPADTHIDLAGSGTLEVNALGTSAISYQWFKNGVAISGATLSTLPIANAQRSDSGDYRVIASNDSGSKTSRVARVEVLAEPIITRQPMSQAVSDGTAVTLEVAALGAGQLSYQWRSNMVALAGANGTTLTVAGTLADSACYDVIITNSLGSITSLPAALGVYVAAGSIDAGFAPPGGANNTVFASAALPNGNVAIAGSFTAVGNDFRSRFAVLDPQGNGVSLANNYAAPQTVLSMAVEPDGKIVMGHNGGNVRLNPDGSVDGTFQGAGGYTPVVAVHNGHTYMGGFFGSFEGSLRRVTSSTGTDDATFGSNTLAAGAQNVTALAFQSDGKILVGESPGSLKRLNADGTLDATFTLSGVSLPRVTALGVAPVGKIWVGSSSSPYLVRLNPDGSLDSSITVSQVDRTVRDLEMVGSDVLVGGDFFPLINSMNYRGLVRVSGSTGQVDPDFGPVLGSTSVYSISDLGAGKVLVGGSFSSPAVRIARVVAQGDVTLAITCQPMDQSLTNGQPLQLTVGWKGGSPATYQWTLAGQNIPGATSQTFRLESVATTNAGIYAVVVSDASGSVTSANANVTVAGGTGGPVESFANYSANLDWMGLDSTPGGDADNDGLRNIVEYAFGSNPLVVETGPSLFRPRVVVVEEGGKRYPAIRFRRHKNRRSAVNIEIAASSTVTFPNTNGTTELTPVDVGNDIEEVTIRSNTDEATSFKMFFRTNVRQSP